MILNRDSLRYCPDPHNSSGAFQRSALVPFEFCPQENRPEGSPCHTYRRYHARMHKVRCEARSRNVVVQSSNVFVVKLAFQFLVFRNLSCCLKEVLFNNVVTVSADGEHACQEQRMPETASRHKKIVYFIWCGLAIEVLVYVPASVQTLRRSAPLNPSQSLQIASKSVYNNPHHDSNFSSSPPLKQMRQLALLTSAIYIIYTCIQVCMYTCVCPYIYIYIDIYMCIRIHFCMHMYIRICRCIYVI